MVIIRHLSPSSPPGGSRRPLSVLLALVLGLTGLVALDQLDLEPAAATQSSQAAPAAAGGNLGAFASGVPIEAPAFHGIEPKLGLVYNSQAGNGLVGVGWGLTVESYIERASKGRGAPTYTGSDIFLLDGEEVVPSTALGGEYVTKRQSYLRIVYDEVNDRIVVTQKNGVKTIYAAKHTVAAGTFRYMRSQVVDPYGNTVNYSYSCDPGKYCYVNKITYGGTAITLYGEIRPDPMRFATGSSPATINYRIKTIDVVSGGGRARAYKLTYATSGPTGRSLLTKVQMFGKDATLDASGTVTGGSALPAITMGYRSDASPSTFGTSKINKSLGGGSTQDWTGWCKGADSTRFGVADFNGDGRDDLWCHNISSGKSQVAIGDKWGVSKTAELTWCPAQLVVKYYENPYRQSGLADFNGDGRTDLWCHKSDDEKIALSDGNGGFTVIAFPSGWCANSQWQVGAGEFNGDGKTDLWCHDHAGGNTQLAVSNGTGGFVLPAKKAGWCAGADNDFGVADFNGDGLTDLWCHNHTNGDTYVAQAKGDGSFTGFNKSMSWCSFGIPQGDSFGVTDHNGDGKSDFWCHSWGAEGNTWVATSNGNGSFTTHPPGMSGWCNAAGNPYQTFSMADFNGDGRDDAWCHDSYHAQTWVAFAQGESGFKKFGLAFNGCGQVGQFGTGDLNGDGKSDFFCHDVSKGDTYMASAGSVLGRTDMLTSQTTGLGGKTTVTYTPASGYANTRLDPSLPMVATSISHDDGRGTVITTNYNYSGARYDPVERRFLGFQVVSAKDSSGAGSWTTFKQDAGYPLGRIIQVDRKNSAGTPLERSGYSYWQSAGGGVYKSLLTSQTHAMCSGATCQTSKTEYSYNDYGNVSLVKLHGDTAVGGDERTEGTTYTYNTAKYIVDTPSQVNTYAGIGTTGPIGKQVKFAYNTAGDVISTSRWLNTKNIWITSKSTYDAYGNLKTKSNPLDAAASKATVTYEYDPTFHQYQTKECNVLGHCTTQVWDPVFQVATSSTDPNNKTTTWAYDTLGRMRQENRPDLSWTKHDWYNLGNASTQYQQDTTSDGTADGQWSRTYIDGLGRTYQQVSEPNIVKLTRYDQQGNVWKVSHPFPVGGAASAKWTVYTYDALGRLTKTTNPDGSQRQTTYGVAVNVNDPDFATPKYRVTECDELATCNSTAFNGHSQPLITSDITPGWAAEHRTHITYDVWGRTKTIKNNIGSTTTLTFDSLDRKISTVDPDSGMWSYEYDSDSRVVRQADAVSNVVTTLYDAVGRLKQEKSGSGAVLATFNYDQPGHGAGIGKRTSMSDLSGSTSWTYDSLGRTTKMDKTVAGTAYSVSQTFDKAGRRATLTYPGGEVVTFGYDAQGCLNKVGGYVTAATCTMDGHSLTRTLGNGVQLAMSYDPNRLWLTGDTVKTGGGAVLQSETYGHNYRGQVTSKTSADAADKWTYAYDGLARFKTATNVGNAAFNVAVSYDTAGRITSKTGAGSYVYPAVNTAGKPDHAPSSVGGKNYSYDANGNRKSDGTTTFGYNVKNWLVSTTKAGVTTSYSYDALGERVKAGGVTTISLDGQQLLRVNGATTVKYYYYGKQRVASRDNTGAVRYYISDHIGNPHLILDSAATVVKRMVLNPFGGVVQQTGSYNDPFGLTGAETDPSGLTHAGARYYDPVLGQFTSPDPSGAVDPKQPQSLNRFSYVQNDPINYTDPSGYSQLPARLAGLAALGKMVMKIPAVQHTVAKVDAAWQRLMHRTGLDEAYIGFRHVTADAVNPDGYGNGFEFDFKIRNVEFEIAAMWFAPVSSPVTVSFMSHGFKLNPVVGVRGNWAEGFIGYRWGLSTSAQTKKEEMTVADTGSITKDFYFGGGAVTKAHLSAQVGAPGLGGYFGGERYNQPISVVLSDTRPSDWKPGWPGLTVAISNFLPGVFSASQPLDDDSGYQQGGYLAGQHVPDAMWQNALPPTFNGPSFNTY